MRIVADTNTFLACALNEPEKERIVELTVGHELIAPEILPFELGNALSAMVKRGRLSRKEALQAYGMAQRIPVTLRVVDIPGALALATAERIYAYDAYFLECARSFSSPLLTLDRPLREVARKIHVELLEDEE